jgi:hypothetical protein
MSLIQFVRPEEQFPNLGDESTPKLAVGIRSVRLQSQPLLNPFDYLSRACGSSFPNCRVRHVLAVIHWLVAPRYSQNQTT